MDALTEVLINIASQAPVIAFLLYVMDRDRKDFLARIDEKNELIDKHRARDWQRLDKIDNK